MTNQSLRQAPPVLIDNGHGPVAKTDFIIEVEDLVKTYSTGDLKVWRHG